MLSATKPISKSRQLLRWRAYYLLEPWGFEFANAWRIEQAEHAAGIRAAKRRKISEVFGYQCPVKPARRLLTPDDFRRIGKGLTK